MFGERKRSEAPAYVPQLPPTTAISNHQLSSGWQNEGFQSSGENFRSNQGGFVSDAKTINDYVGFVATGIEVAPGSFRLGTLGQGFSPKYYASAWRGNQYATTYNIGKLGKGLGVTGSLVGLALDAQGVRNYYNPKYGPNNPNSVSLAKATLNTGMSAYGIFVHAIPALLYNGIDMFYPGGWTGNNKHPGLANDQQRLYEENKAINPNWQHWPGAMKL